MDARIKSGQEGGQDQSSRAKAPSPQPSPRRGEGLRGAHASKPSKSISPLIVTLGLDPRAHDPPSRRMLGGSGKTRRCTRPSIPQHHRMGTRVKPEHDDMWGGGDKVVPTTPPSLRAAKGRAAIQSETHRRQQPYRRKTATVSRWADQMN